MSTTALKVRLYGDPVLRKRAAAVRKITPYHREALSRMAQAMYEGAGVGLAAPQAGILEAMIVADIGSGLYKLINPRITKRAGRQSQEEGCLSVPGICVRVRRAKKILLHAQDEEGRPLSIEAEGLLACVLQHEADHLRGKLIVDYASFFEKLKMKKKLEALKKKAKDESLSQPETKSCQLQL
jgi:peptide deformylase